ISLIFIMAATFSVHAYGYVSGAKIVKIRIDHTNGHAMLFFDKDVVDSTGERIPCIHEAYKNAFGIDTTTEAGKAVLSWALSAKITGCPVNVYGMGSCEGVYNGRHIEMMNYGVIL
ncbi:hypothetical protein, partial [Desulfatiferula olefinivorans]